VTSHPVQHSLQSSQQPPAPKSTPSVAVNDASARKRLAVAPSPLNEVKLELGVILLAGTVLWLAADSITANVATQLLILLGYGMSAAAWLVFRTRRIVRQLAAGASPADSHQSDVIHPGHETQ